MKLLFTHTDLDGAGCRVLFEIANRDRPYRVVRATPFTIENVVRNTVGDLTSPALKLKIEEIFFADICPQMSTISELKDAGHKVKVFDHHQTNSNMNVFPDLCIVSEVGGVKQSGTNLLCEALQANGVLPSCGLIDEFAETVRSYDTFEWKETGDIKAKKLQSLFVMMGIDRFCEHYIDRLSNFSEKSLIDPKFEELIDARLEQEERIISSFSPRDVHEMNIAGYNTAVVLNNKGCNISDIAYEFLRKYTEYDAMIGVSFAHGGGAYALRSAREDVNVAKIAEALGSGGHATAAGAGMSASALRRIVGIIEEDLKRAERRE